MRNKIAIGICIFWLVYLSLVFATHHHKVESYGYTKPANFTTLATKTGWPSWQQRTLACVITRESGWNPKAWNKADPGYGSLGWLQINMSKGRYGTWTYYRNMLNNNMFQLFHPETNLKVARDLYVRSVRIYGDGWRAWRPLGRCA